MWKLQNIIDMLQRSGLKKGERGRERIYNLNWVIMGDELNDDILNANDDGMGDDMEDDDELEADTDGTGDDSDKADDEEDEKW